MRLRITQGGQTGVDRGAWLEARDAGVERRGWMPHDMRDELGPIPAEVADDLWQHDRGLRSRTVANVLDADAVLIIVPNAAQGCRTPGTRETWRLAKRDEVPVLVIDGSDLQVRRVAPWLLACVAFEEPAGAFSLMISGPRASLWPDGEAVARDVVGRVIAELRKTTP